MPLTDYSRHFCDRHNGPLRYVTVLTQPIKSKYDPKLSDTAMQRLNDVCSASMGNQSVTLALFEKSVAQRALILSAMAYQTKHPVFFVSCAEFFEHYRDDTERNITSLLARAEGKPAIFYFEEFDCLLSNRSPSNSDEQPVHDADEVNKALELRASYLMQTFGTYGGLVLLSIDTRKALDKIAYACEVLD